VTSVEDGNSTDGKNKAVRMIAAISTTKEPAKPNGPTQHGQTDAGRRNYPAEDKDKGNAPVQKSDKARGTIELATTKGSTRRDRSPRMPTRTKGTKGVDGTGQGRKDSLEKRILAVSQTEEAPESLRCPESRRSTSEDSVTQKETELSEKRAEPVNSDDIMESMAKGCIEIVDGDE
jgi:hypothetical protein